MPAITVEIMLSSAIAMLNQEVEALLPSLIDTEWLQQPDVADLFDHVLSKALQIEAFVEKLVSTAKSLMQKGLTPELKLSEDDSRFKFNICKDIGKCLHSAYKAKITPEHVGPAYFAVLIKDTKKDNHVVSTALADFLPYPDNEFAMKMEAVEKKWQRKQVGTAMFHFSECAVRYLLLTDGFVCMNMAGDQQCSISACVDRDAPEWHSTMMEKLGFEADNGWYEDDIKFCKIIEDTISCSDTPY